MAFHAKAARPTKPRAKKTTVATTAQATPPAAATDGGLLNTNFVCSVCEKKRQSNATDGRQLYGTAPNGDRICHGCIDKRDTLAMEKGGVSMNIIWDGTGWAAENDSGKMRYKLMDKGSHIKTVANPSFVAKGGAIWSGRLYAQSGKAYFQVKDAAKTSRPAAARAARTRAPGRKSVARTEPATPA